MWEGSKLLFDAGLYESARAPFMTVAYMENLYAGRAASKSGLSVCSRKKKELEGRKREPHRESFQMGRERSLRSFVPIDEITGHRSIP